MGQVARREWLARAGLVGAGAALATVAAPGTAEAVPVAPTGVNVRDYGAVGDGVADDTMAVQNAVNAALGDLVYFPAGVYLLNKVALTRPADLVLGVGATLRHLPAGADDYMLGFSTSYLRIRGGTLDGNKAQQTGRTTLVAGAVEKGKTVILDGVRVVNSVKAVVYAYTFGGLIRVVSCSFEGQAQHDGIPGHYTAIVAVISGQPGTRGVLVFNFNTAVGGPTAVHSGGYPGGVFYGPKTSSTTGSGATLEAIGNSFYGYGQNCAGNTISPLHTYPAVQGARIIGNHFEACGCAAISAKSVDDFYCAGNVIVNGLVHPANTPAEGAITYAPSYLAGSTQHPRAVITGNTVVSPGGTATRPTNGIGVFGSSTSVASRVIVTDNIVDQCGTGITVSRATDVIVSGNIVNGRTSTPLATSAALRLDNCSGRISVTDNKVVNKVNHGMLVYAGMQNASVRISGNEVQQDAIGYYGMFLGGIGSVSVVGNAFSGAAYSYTARAYGTQHLRRFHTDASNTFTAGRTPVIVWSELDAVFGDCSYRNSPRGVVAPGEVGVRYTQRNGTPGSTLWVSTGTSRTSWVPVG